MGIYTIELTADQVKTLNRALSIASLFYATVPDQTERKNELENLIPAINAQICS